MSNQPEESITKSELKLLRDKAKELDALKVQLEKDKANEELLVIPVEQDLNKPVVTEKDTFECSRCGAKVEENTELCHSCGEYLEWE